MKSSNVNPAVMLNSTKPKRKRKPHKGEVTCRCNAAKFPHRLGSTAGCPPETISDDEMPSAYLGTWKRL